MYQRARQSHRTTDVTQRRTADVEPPRSTVGKRTLTQEQTFGTPDRYTRAIEAARRELRAVRSVVLPALIKALRNKHLEPIAKQAQLAHGAAQVRHLLMTANQHVRALEKAASYRDPIILFLRHDVDTLTARATKLGLYRGAEDMLPRAHVEESKQVQARGESALLVRKPKPAHQRMQALVARDRIVAAPPGTRVPPSSPGARTAVQRRSAAAVQRKAAGANYARDVHAVAARGVEGASQPLPFVSQIQRAFGRHDVSTIRVSIGGAAAKAAQELGAKAYATGETIAFASAPDLHTAAHEAAHVVQQRRGASPAGGIDAGSHDSLERQADAVADSVVAGGSVEALLDSIACGAVTRSVQRKEAGATEPDTKYTFRRKSELRFKIGVVPAKLEMRWELSLKDKGTLHTGLPEAKTDATYGANQVMLESSARGLDAKVSSSLAKVTYEAFAEGRLPDELGALPIVPKIEMKGLEGGLSIRDGWDLKLMTLSVYLEGDFSGLFDESKRSYLEAKGQVRIECALEPGLAKQLVELARASDAVTRSARLEEKIAKTEKSLSYWKHRRGAKDKVAKLEKELAKLRGVRGAVNKARDAGLKTIQRVGTSLEKTAAGRLVKKLGTKALATAFKKFIPIYNLVSTAQDLYEAGNYLAGLDWSKIGWRIVDGGPGGTVMGDGSHDEGDGVGAEFGDGGSSDDVSADAIQSELKQEANVELHSTAQALVSVLEAQVGGGSETQALSPEDKQTINFVVPTDLTSDEIAIIKARLVEVQGGTRQDLVTTVIETVQQMRPFGEPIGPAALPHEGAGKQTTQPDSGPSRPRRSRPKKEATKSAKKPVGSKTGGSTVDLEAVLARLSTMDEQFRTHIPAVIELPGLRARVERVGEFKVSLGTNDREATETNMVVSVTVTPIEVQPGFKTSTGAPLQVGVSLGVAVTLRPRQQGEKR